MKKYINTVLLIIWMGVIYFLSCQNGDTSGSLSDGLLYKIATVLNIEDIELFISNYAHLIRKLAHFIEYFILGFLMYITVKEYSNKNILIVSTVLCLVYATSDEIHQYFIDGRVGSILDVLLDTIGSFVGSLIIHLIKNKCYQEKKH